MGDSKAGKTSLVLRFVEGSYREDRPSTVGAFFITKRLLVNNILCKLSIWDTSGQYPFRPLAKMYYSNAAAAILCFSYASRQSWMVTQYWLEELHRNVPAGNIVLCLCACQTDVLPHVVSAREAHEAAAANGAMLLETSAAQNHNVTQVFSRVAERVLQFHKKERETGQGKIPVTPGATPPPQVTGMTTIASNVSPSIQQQLMLQQQQQPLQQPQQHNTGVNRFGVVVEEEREDEEKKSDSISLAVEKFAPLNLLTSSLPSPTLDRTYVPTPKRRDKRTRSVPQLQGAKEITAEEEVHAPQPDMCGLIPSNMVCVIS